MLATTRPVHIPGHQLRLAYIIKSDNTPAHAQLNGVRGLDKIATCEAGNISAVTNWGKLIPVSIS